MQFSKSLDQVAFFVGICGVVFLITGIALVSVPLSLITCGIICIAWSFITARAVAGEQSGKNSVSG